MKGDRPHEMQLVKGKAYIYKCNQENFIVLRYPELNSILCEDIKRDCQLRGTPNIREYIELIPIHDGDLYVYKYVEGEPISNLFSKSNKTFMQFSRVKGIIT